MDVVERRREEITGLTDQLTSPYFCRLFILDEIDLLLQVSEWIWSNQRGINHLILVTEEAFCKPLVRSMKRKKSTWSRKKQDRMEFNSNAGSNEFHLHILRVSLLRKSRKWHNCLRGFPLTGWIFISFWWISTFHHECLMTIVTIMLSLLMFQSFVSHVEGHHHQVSWNVFTLEKSQTNYQIGIRIILIASRSGK